MWILYTTDFIEKIFFSEIKIGKIYVAIGYAEEDS